VCEISVAKNDVETTQSLIFDRLVFTKLLNEPNVFSL